MLASRSRVTDVSAAALVLVLAVVNAVLLPASLRAVLAGEPAVDWLQFVESGRRVVEGGLYETSGSYGYRWSPLMAHVFGFIGGMGTAAWRLVHVLAALALPTWPLRLVTLASWPFWSDVETGNVLIFVVLAAAWAVRGSRVGAGSFLVLAVLIPRPLMIPVAAWILWKQPEWRIPFAFLFVAHLGGVIATGWGMEWAELLMTIGADVDRTNNLGPGRFIGAAWIVIGIPLAVVLTMRGRLGWASLASSHPYVLGYYFLMLVLEVPDRWGWTLRRRKTAERQAAQ